MRHSTKKKNCCRTRKTRKHEKSTVECFFFLSFPDTYRYLVKNDKFIFSEHKRQPDTFFGYLLSITVHTLGFKCVLRRYDEEPNFLWVLQSCIFKMTKLYQRKKSFYQFMVFLTDQYIFEFIALF